MISGWKLFQNLNVGGTEITTFPPDWLDFIHFALPQEGKWEEFMSVAEVDQAE